MISEKIITDISSKLEDSIKQHKSISPITEDYPEITIVDAYKVQLRTVENQLQAGNSISGKKIGLTSKAMQNMFNVYQPDYGHLFSSMEVEDDGIVEIDTLFLPKIEAEVAFILKEDLIGPNLTAEDVIRATDYVVPALEIVDSRIQDWQIKIEDTIADNASSAMYVLGKKKVFLNEVDLSEVTMQLFENEKYLNKGKGADVLGNPIECVVWLANQMAEYGVSLKAKEVILSGALSGAVDVQAGNKYCAKFSELGEVSVSFK